MRLFCAVELFSVSARESCHMASCLGGPGLNVAESRSQQAWVQKSRMTVEATTIPYSGVFLTPVSSLWLQRFCSAWQLQESEGSDLQPDIQEHEDAREGLRWLTDGSLSSRETSYRTCHMHRCIHAHTCAFMEDYFMVIDS